MDSGWILLLVSPPDRFLFKGQSRCSLVLLVGSQTVDPLLLSVLNQLYQDQVTLLEVSNPDPVVV